MRHEQQRHAALDEELLQPLDRVDVQMVRRLVEQQHVGLPHERACEQRLALAAAAGVRERRLGVEAQVHEHRVDARLHLPRVGGVERVVQPVHLLQRRVAAARRDAVARLVIARQQPSQVAQPLGHDVERAAAEIAGDLLLQPCDGDAGLAHDLARVGAHLAVEQLHERALPGAVPAEQADALAALDPELGMVEDGRAAEGDADVLQADEGHEVRAAGCGATEVRSLQD